MIQGFDHAALSVADLPRAAAFYQDVLGMRPVDTRDPAVSSYFWLNFGPMQTLNLTLAPQLTPKALAVKTDLNVSPHLAFAAPEAFLELLSQRLEVCRVPFHRSQTGLYFSDPDGNFLEVTCWREKSLQETGAEHW